VGVSSYSTRDFFVEVEESSSVGTQRFLLSSSSVSFLVTFCQVKVEIWRGGKNKKGGELTFVVFLFCVVLVVFFLIGVVFFLIGFCSGESETRPTVGLTLVRGVGGVAVIVGVTALGGAGEAVNATFIIAVGVT
jgi:hypothetical protein